MTLSFLLRRVGIRLCFYQACSNLAHPGRPLFGHQLPLPWLWCHGAFILPLQQITNTRLGSHD